VPLRDATGEASPGKQAGVRRAGGLDGPRSARCLDWASAEAGCRGRRLCTIEKGDPARLW